MKFTVKPEWEAFQLPYEIGSGRADFAHGPEGPRIHMEFYRHKSTGELVGGVSFAAVTAGPPGYVHGGLNAFVLDEAMGSAAWLAGHQVVAAHLEFDYLHMAPVEQWLSVQAKVTSVEGGKVNVEGVVSLDGKDLVKSTGLFIVLDDLEALGT